MPRRSRGARSRSRCRALRPRRPRPPPPRWNRWARRSRSRRRGACLWRAGFGPTPGQAEALVGQPLRQVVYGLTRPSGAATLSGPNRSTKKATRWTPYDVWGDDHCWWLDRMVRSDQQLVERMTFIFHDWFANSNEKVNSQRMMLEQNELFRQHGLRQLSRPVPRSHHQPGDARVSRRDLQRKGQPQRELRARDDGAVLTRRRSRRIHRGRRARNGPRADRLDERNGPKAGLQNFHYDTAYHDKHEKTVFGKTGNWN